MARVPKKAEDAPFSEKHQAPGPVTTGAEATPETVDTVIAHGIYGLYALGFLAITPFIGVILAYVNRADVAGTWLEGHYRWQIRTFWFALLFFAIGGVLAVIAIGWPIWFATLLWCIYRVAKGWVYLIKRKPLLYPHASD